MPLSDYVLIRAFPGARFHEAVIVLEQIGVAARVSAPLDVGVSAGVAERVWLIHVGPWAPTDVLARVWEGEFRALAPKAWVPLRVERAALGRYAALLPEGETLAERAQRETRAVRASALRLDG